jgi:hypothetical protein
VKFIATLVNSNKKAIKILKEIPENSVVLFPESVSLNGSTVKKYSLERGLFIIYNSDTNENGKFYISMRGVDEGDEYPYVYLTGETNSGICIQGKDTINLL